MHHFYRPQRSCGQGNVFTGVCHSFCSQEGGSPENPPSRKNPPGRENPPRPGRTPPDQGEPPRTRENPPDQGEPLPGPGRPPLGPGRTPPPGRRLQHTVYERPVRILLECILVSRYVFLVNSFADSRASFTAFVAIISFLILVHKTSSTFNHSIFTTWNFSVAFKTK